MARDYDGSADHSQASDVPVTSYPIWVEVWFYPTAASQTGVIWSVSRTNSTNFFATLGVNSSDFLELQLRSSGAAAMVVTTDPETFNLNAWNHAVVFHESATLHSVVLNNGTRGHSTTNKGFPGALAVTTIGAIETSAGFTSRFQGRIAEICVRNADLGTVSSPQIQALDQGHGSELVRRDTIQSYNKHLGIEDPEPDFYSPATALTLTSAPPKADHPPIFYPYEDGVFAPVGAAPAAVFGYDQQSEHLPTWENEAVEY